MDTQAIRRVGALHARVPTASGRPVQGQDFVESVEAGGVLNDTACQQCAIPLRRALCASAAAEVK